MRLEMNSDSIERGNKICKLAPSTIAATETVTTIRKTILRNLLNIEIYCDFRLHSCIIVF